MSNWRDPKEGDLGPQEMSRTPGFEQSSNIYKKRLSIWRIDLSRINLFLLFLVTSFLMSKISSEKNRVDQIQKQVSSLQSPLATVIAGETALSPDGKTMAILDKDGFVGIWSVDDGKLVKKLDGQKNEITKIIYSPNASMLFTGSLDGTVAFWDVSAGELSAEVSLSSRVLDLTISSDDKNLWAMTDKEISQINIDTQKKIVTQPNRPLISPSRQ
jgi:WD40 repeat protein